MKYLTVSNKIYLNIHRKTMPKYLSIKQGYTNQDKGTSRQPRRRTAPPRRRDSGTCWAPRTSPCRRRSRDGRLLSIICYW